MANHTRRVMLQTVLGGRLPMNSAVRRQISWISVAVRSKEDFSTEGLGYICDHSLEAGGEIIPPNALLYRCSQLIRATPTSWQST